MLIVMIWTVKNIVLCSPAPVCADTRLIGRLVKVICEMITLCRSAAHLSWQ